MTLSEADDTIVSHARGGIKAPPMVADRLNDERRPANGNGLIVAKPAEEPTQSYGWWVTGKREVWSFIDHWCMAGRGFDDHPDLLRSQLGGTPVPVFKLRFHGNRVWVEAD